MRLSAAGLPHSPEFPSDAISRAPFKLASRFRDFHRGAAAQETLPGSHAPEVSPIEPGKIPEVAEAAIFLDADRPLEKRLADLVRRMSLAEKVVQLRNSAPAIPRL